MEKITPYTLQESDRKLTIHLNPSADRALLPSILVDPGIDKLPFFAKSVLLEGKAPNWMYAHFAVRAVVGGANEVYVRQVAADITKIWPHGAEKMDLSEKACFKMVTEKPGVVRLEFNTAPYETGGKWAMADFINTPLCIPDKTEVLIIWGYAANWMCAAATIAVCNAGIQYILYGSPREKSYISIGLLEPGKCVPYRKRVENGLVIGIAGDPNSGKSVFKSWLEKIIKDEWPNSWWIEADPASPTPNWFLDGFSSRQKEEVEKIRKEVKQKWTHELELMVADILRNARENLDVTLVDLPGGDIKSSPAQRIPPGREVIYKEIDLFIIICKNEAARQGWLSALREHNLENLVFAEIDSQEPDGPPSLETRREGHKIIGTARGLDRRNSGHSVKPLIRAGASEFIRHIHAWVTAQYAKAAVAKAFLTGQGGVRYGAAVLCADGKIYTAGQYSSFNHCTNVHAEKGALLQAAMNGSFAVRVLALASTDKSAVPRPCGVCRQDMLEYIRRTGSPFDVAMVDHKGHIEIETIETLLPFHWESHRSRKNQDKSLRQSEPYLLSRSQDEHFRTGDCLQWPGKETGMQSAIGILWDSAFLPGFMLVKLKYLKKTSGEWHKLPHSLTDSFYYMDELKKAGFAGPTGFGPSACLVTPSEIEGIRSPKIEGDAKLPETFLRFLEDAEIDISRFRYTGSRALGLEQQDSDFDIFMEAKPEEVLQFRKTAEIYKESGKAIIPRESGTWQLFDKAFPGGSRRITEEGRFFESLEFDGKKVSIIFTSEEKSLVYDENEWEPLGWHTVSGLVTEASCAPFKRAYFTLNTDFRKAIEVISYHKFANLVKTGDRLSIGGWLLNNKKIENTQRLVQLLPAYDPIVWFP